MADSSPETFKQLWGILLLLEEYSFSDIHNIHFCCADTEEANILCIGAWQAHGVIRKSEAFHRQNQARVDYSVTALSMLGVE